MVSQRRRPAPARSPTLGIDIGATHFRLVLLSPNGRVVARGRGSTGVGSDPAAVLERIAAAGWGLSRSARARPRRVGVGIAAQVDRRGIVRLAPNLGWRNVPLGAGLSRALGWPTVVTNDVRAAAVGEWRFGAGRGARDLVTLFIGTGLGGGVVSDGRLLTGAGNSAGELGHTTLFAGGRTCTCGRAGCLEAYVSGWALGQRWKETRAPRPARRRRSNDPGDPSVFAAARRGDRRATELLRTASAELAAGIVGIANAFNPDRLVIGGGVATGYPELVRRAWRLARPAMLPTTREPLEWRPAALGDWSVAIGAAAIAAERVA